jgi:hypothetical protein
MMRIVRRDFHRRRARELDDARLERGPQSVSSTAFMHRTGRA